MYQNSLQPEKFPQEKEYIRNAVFAIWMGASYPGIRREITKMRKLK
jgi:hypothetical protein